MSSLAAANIGWKSVDQPRVNSLALASCLGHRVHRDAAVDPCGVVALEQVVRERRQHEVFVVEQPPQQAGPLWGRQVLLEDATDHEVGEVLRLGVGDELAQRLDQRRSHGLVVNDALQKELASGRLLQGLRRAAR